MTHLLDNLRRIEGLVNNSPVMRLQAKNVQLFAKLEFCNYSGSLKDRAAYNILHQAIEAGEINEHTTVIESSSGNLAISLAHMCKSLGLKFIPVIDPNINKTYEATLRLFCETIVRVTERDHTDGYLLTRIKTVKELCSNIRNSFWTNQYGNANNYQAYQQGMSMEIARQLPGLDYVFVAVSSGGTITGLSTKLKELIPSVKVVAVDVDGSIALGGLPKRRFISGIGASCRSEFLHIANIDHVIHVPQPDIVRGAHRLLREHQLFAGASTGAVYAAAENFFAQGEYKTNVSAMFLAADRGQAYIDNIYSEAWCERLTQEVSQQAEISVQ